MSKQFRIGYTESVSGWYYFDAETLEEAQDLIEKIDNGDLDVNDLPGVVERTNNYESEWITNVEEVAPSKSEQESN